MNPARLFLLIAALILPAGLATADDFASDLAQCAKAPIAISSFASDELRKAARFVVEHGECVPMVTGGDPLLYGMTPGVAYLQQKEILGKSAQACFDDSFGKGSREMAGVLSKFIDAPPMSTLVPSKGKQLLLQIAEGQANEALYQVPGVSLVSSHMSCACAVSSTGMDLNALREKIKETIESLETCKNVLGKLLGKAYDTAKAAFDLGKDAVNAMGCTLGLGGCSDGPPYFCTVYFAHRATGATPDQILNSWPDVPEARKLVQSGIDHCEPQWLAKVDEKQKADAAALAQQLLDKEIEKAQQGGSSVALGFAFRWSPKCWDGPCKTAISKYADLFNAEIKDPDTVAHYGTFGAAAHALEAKYASLAKAAIAMSKDRRDQALRNNPGAPVSDRLDAFGCAAYLGRPRQSLCKSPVGFNACVSYVRSDAWDTCALASKDGQYSEGAALKRHLKTVGCIPQEGRLVALSPSSKTFAQCLGSRALASCQRLEAGHSPVTCGGAKPLSFDRRRLPGSLPPVTVQTPSPRLAPVAPAQPHRQDRVVEKSTLCQFESGPRAGQRQDYAPMAPLPVGTPCHDGRGSSGHVVK